MTPRQLKHRGHAISSSKAKRSGDPRRLAIVASKWKSPSKWAEERADISASSMTNYLKGKTAVPEEVQKLFYKDFSGFELDGKVYDFAPGAETWPLKKL